MCPSFHPNEVVPWQSASNNAIDAFHGMFSGVVHDFLSFLRTICDEETTSLRESPHSSMRIINFLEACGIGITTEWAPARPNESWKMSMTMKSLLGHALFELGYAS